jgi:sulfoxide reductase heme-binding subunit YedZ
MGKLGVPPPPKAWVFVLAAAPLALLIAGAFELAGKSLGPNPIRELTHVTGKTALNMVLITLMVSPVRALTGDPRWLRLRRMLGLWTFSYAALHLIIYVVLELDLDLRDLGRELVKRPFIWVGAAALIGLLPLAVTSTDRWMRRLGRRWRTLHWLVYPVAVLAVWHFWWQVKADIREPALYAAVLAALLAWRVWQRWKTHHASRTRIN